MRHTQSELKSVSVYRRLVPQAVHGCAIDGDYLHLYTRAGPKTLELHSQSFEVRSDWLILSKLILKSPDGTYVLGGMWGDATETLSAAINEAGRRQHLRVALVAEWPRLESAYLIWHELCAAVRYLPASVVRSWRAGLAELPFPTERDPDLVAALPPDRQFILGELTRLQADPEPMRQERNADYVEGELERFRAFFDFVKRYPLTEQQRRAVVHDEDNALVVAGAGTGKTSTILAKVGYLLTRGFATSEEILLLAFTQQAAAELRSRIEKKFGVSAQVRTFHALGLQILAAAGGGKPSRSRETEDVAARGATLRTIVHRLLADRTFRRQYLQFHTMLRAPYRSAWEFATEAEYRAYLLDVEPRTFTGCRVRSYEECEIANWLFLNGVRFEYEHPYPVNTATREYRQYRPDFYLPEADLYIEHWGVDREGHTPPFMDNDRYRQKMEWARRLHQEHGATLVETYSWERQAGVLLDNLESKLRARGVSLGSRTVEEGLQILKAAGAIPPFETLCGTFLSRFKSGGHDLRALGAKAGAREDAPRALLFLQLFAQVQDRYEERLQARQEIDFEDMINRATTQVQAGRFLSPFRYIIVDEFQDLAEGRARLIEALRLQAPGSKLFCVGDDWQSIYRFTGSDLALMTRFEQRFGATHRTLLDCTFRFNDQLAAFSSQFVLRNPVQIRKSLGARETGSEPAVEVWFGESKEVLPRILATLCEGSSVFVLNRYHRPAEATFQQQLVRLYPRLRIQFHTVHRAKGLEADYVIVDQLRSGRCGFPCEIADDPILELVLAEPDQFPHGEERRLFYVALTRARKRVFLVSDPHRVSEFVREVLDDETYEKVVVGDAPAAAAACPACGSGRLVHRGGARGAFYGCSKYLLGEHTEEA